MLSHLECTRCKARRPAAELATLCACGGVLFARYAPGQGLERAAVLGRPPGLWRLRELMPLPDPGRAVDLGEARTPLRRAGRLGRSLGLAELYIKDETLNPTGSFKARGIAAAVSCARELGVKAGVIPSAGNAGLAFAAYAAAAGLEARVIVPRATPEAFKREVELHGAELVEVEGSISDAGRLARASGLFNFATFAEPYRVEGKKTMGFELAFELGFELPDVVIYPTGGGTGLVGMWKAFDELEALGWIGTRRPRMVAVQAEGCAPVVEAFASGALETTAWPEPETLAAGLRVPAPLAGYLILAAIRASGGSAIAVSDAAIRKATLDLARLEGLLGAPEAGATVAALEELKGRGEIRPRDRVVLFITGGGTRYLDSLSAR